MAKVTIGAWDVAQLLGLEYLGAYTEYCYKYSINHQTFTITHGYGDDEAVDEEEAHEEAGKRVLAILGKMIVV